VKNPAIALVLLLVLATPSAANPYADAVLLDRPIAYWPLADVGPSAADALGLNPGTLLLGVTPGVPGPIPGLTAMRFPGQSGVLCPSITISAEPRSLAFRNEGAVEAWVRTTAPEAVVVRWRWFGYGLLIQESRLRFGFHLNDGTNVVEHNVFGTTTGLNDGNWHHLVASWDGERVTLWLDGVFNGDGAVAGKVFYTGWVSSSDFGEFAIGRDGDACGDHFDSFDGDMAHVAVYGHALDADRVAEHYRIALEAGARP
jgi:hypothetical protein